MKMKLKVSGFILLLFLCCQPIGIVYAASSVIPKADLTVQINSTQNNALTALFPTNEALALSVQMAADSDNINEVRPIYLVTQKDGDWYQYDQSENWLHWDQDINHLNSYTNQQLQQQHAIHLPPNTQNSGHYKLFVGYLNHENQIIYNQQALTFTIFDESKPGLHRFSSSAMLAQFLKDGLKSQADININPRFSFFAEDAVISSPPPANVQSTAQQFSTTNIQELGVEEADRIKTNGSSLYVLNDCKSNVTGEEKDIETNKSLVLSSIAPTPVFDSCLTVYQFTNNGAKTEEIDQVSLDSNLYFDKLYLATGQTTDQTDWLIGIGQNNNTSQIWYNPWSWQSQSTIIQWMDISNSASPELTRNLKLDGSLVSSRRIDRILYVVTRHTPWIQDYNPYPADETERIANEKLLQNTSLSELLPSVSYDRDTFRQLVEAQDCYLPPITNDTLPDPSIITITAIPLDDPENTRSNCIVGSSETLYMSPDSLYLATTKYIYPRFFIAEQLAIDTDEPVFKDEHTTEIHKFSIDGANIEYKGSGKVIGHLGWHEDKKPFRMSEHNDILRVATSVGDSWMQDSSTQLSTLKENTEAAQLDVIATLEGIGKPGEQLYAARFVGSRGYLVTFRLTDPLYVIDLSNPDSPRVLGELEIDGYSDYLHPVGEDYLIGIGKDAIADTQSTDRLGQGAWYQGLKLSLFDVSDPNTPLEVNSIVLGKRGTESDVLNDHHALAYLPPNGLRAGRLAIPVRLHEDVPAAHEDLSQPRAWYNHTHTGLYLFDINTDTDAKIQLHGKILSEQATEFSTYSPRTDRAVLFGDNVHYIQANEVTSAPWSGF